MTQFFLRTYSFPQVIEVVAEQAEQAGWDGLMLQDSHNLTPDVVVAMTMAARVTDELVIGTAVTNLVTRNPAVVAGAFATLDMISDGRAMLGVTRGDTALHLVGQAPPRLDEFATLVERTRAYLHGDSVESAGVSSRVAWLDEPARVPINVFASGPKNLALAARVGDMVTMSLGAEPEQIAWGLEQVRAADAGVPVGALIVAATGMDRMGLREYVCGNAIISTHFRRGAENFLDAADRRVVEAGDHDYELCGHSDHSSQQARDLPQDFIDRFCVIGEPGECVERLTELVALGLDHVIILGGGLDASPQLRLQMDGRFGREVVSHLR